MCFGCLPTEKERQKQIELTSIKAKFRAIELKKTMVVYDKPNGTIGYMEADKAEEFNITPIKFITQHR